MRELIKFGRQKPTLTLVTDSGPRSNPAETEMAANHLLMSRLLTSVLDEPMREIFSVDLAHFIGELRNGYKDILIDLVCDSLRSTSVAGCVQFAGKGTFELDWNTSPVVRLDFIWNGPFYDVSFEMERRGNEMQCYLNGITARDGESGAKASKHFVECLYSELTAGTV